MDDGTDGATPSGQSNQTSRPSSRVLAYRPSYMSANVQTQRPAISAAAQPPPTNRFTSSHGSLLIVIQGPLKGIIMLGHVESLLRKHTFGGIVVAGDSDADVTRFKMDLYAMLGRLRLELPISTYRLSDWQAHINDVDGAGIEGVLCHQRFEDNGPDDVINLTYDELEKAFRDKISFLHATALVTIPLLRSKCAKISEPSAPRPFFMLAGALRPMHSVAAQMAWSASDSMMRCLTKSNRPVGMTVGYAEAILAPSPARTPPPPGHNRRSRGSESGSNGASYGSNGYANGGANGSGRGFTNGSAPGGSSHGGLSESPTKLWDLWSRHN